MDKDWTAAPVNECVAEAKATPVRVYFGSTPVDLICPHRTTIDQLRMLLLARINAGRGAGSEFAAADLLLASSDEPHKLQIHKNSELLAPVPAWQNTLHVFMAMGRQWQPELGGGVVVIKSLSGAAWKAAVTGGDMTVLQLKGHIEKELSYPTFRQKMVFAGQYLDNSKTMTESDIFPGVEINLVPTH